MQLLIVSLIILCNRANYQTTQHNTTQYNITKHYTEQHYTTLHYTILHYTTLHYTTLHNPTPHGPGSASSSALVTWPVSWSSAHPPDPLLFTNQQTVGPSRMRSPAWSEQVPEPPWEPAAGHPWFRVTARTYIILCVCVCVCVCVWQS